MCIIIYIENTLIEHSDNKIFIALLFILEHTTSIAGNTKNIAGQSFGKYSGHFKLPYNYMHN